MNVRALLTLLLLTASTPILAGGSDGPSREERWATFHNPLAGYSVEEVISGNTIRRVLGQLGMYELPGSDSTVQWSRDASFYKELAQLLSRSNRDLALSSISINEAGCLNVLAQYRPPASLFTKGLELGHKEIISQEIWTSDGTKKGYRVPHEEFLQWSAPRNDNTVDARYLDWRRAAIHAWETVVRGYYWHCNQVDPESEAYLNHHSEMTPSARDFFPDQEEYLEALSLIKGTRVYEFLENYRRFINTPTAETARYLASEKTRDFVKAHTADNQMYNYEHIVKYAQNYIERDSAKLIEYPGGLPLEKPSWRRCANEGALRGTLDLAREWISDESLSDFAVRNALYYRLNIAAECNNKPVKVLGEAELASIPDVWRAYMAALGHFYREDFQHAGNAFSALIDSENAYVADLSSYLAGRSFHIASQRDWSGYGKPDDSIDRKLLSKADKYYHLHAGRSGYYAKSAEGLLRNVAYLSGDMGLYQSRFMRQAENTLQERNAYDLLNLILEGTRFEQSIALLEYLDSHYEMITKDTSLSVFTPLMDFWRGVQSFNVGDWLVAYEKFQVVDVELTYPYLVYIAEQLNDRQRIDAIYKRFLEGNTLLLYLASLEYPQRGPDIFLDTDSTDLARELALAHCSVDELHRLLEDNLQHKHLPALRDALYDTYIQREEFEKLHELMNSGKLNNGHYETIRTAVRQLARSESLGKAYMNIGYFVATRMEIPNHSGAYQILAELDEKRFCAYGLKNHSRGPQYFYQISLAQFGPNDHSEDEAKALHYMINCDRRGRHGCWGVRPRDTETSEQLFRRLHDKYPDSIWAKRTPYYY